MNARFNSERSTTMNGPQKSSRRDTKSANQDDMKTGQKQLMLATTSPPGANDRERSVFSEILAELRKLRHVNGESFQDTKVKLNRLEASVGEIKQQMDKLDERVTEAENRVSAADDQSMQQERVVGYLLRREASLAAKCDDMENRMRRNNVRLYRIREGVEKNDMLAFITDFFHSALDLQGVDINLERAYRALAPKPQDATAPLR